MAEETKISRFHIGSITHHKTLMPLLFEFIEWKTVIKVLHGYSKSSR